MFVRTQFFWAFPHFDDYFESSLITNVRLKLKKAGKLDKIHIWTFWLKLENTTINNRVIMNAQVWDQTRLETFFEFRVLLLNSKSTRTRLDSKCFALAKLISWRGAMKSENKIGPSIEPCTVLCVKFISINVDSFTLQ